MAKTTPKRPRTLAPSASAQLTAQVLAVAPRLLASMRNAYSLSSPSLSLLYSAAALQVDKAGRFTVLEVVGLTGLGERKGCCLFKQLERAGYVRRVGGHLTWQRQAWSLTAEGWALVADVRQRANTLLFPLLNREPQ